jgi:hypothetical protein
MPKVQKFGTTRNYSRVIILSIITLGIYYFFYQYWIFDDLNEHHQKAFSTETRSFPTMVNPTTMLIFLIVFPLYPIYIKYRLLHNHIETSKIKSPSNCTIGLNATLSFLFLGVCTLGIMPLVLEFRWQKAFNEHIEAHLKLSTKKG